MIRKVLLSAVASVAVCGSAFAADLPSRRAPPVYVPPIPVFTWTGFYIGGQIGFGFGTDKARLVPGNEPVGGTGFARPNGIVGGGHVGYNYSTQSLGGFGSGLFGGGLVIGVEGDFDGSDYRDTLGIATLRNQVQGSARGRLGIAVDRALFYVTGGAAFAQFQTTYAFTPAAGGFRGLSNTRIGYTVGGGVEYAVTTQWSLRAEYRYSDFGTFRNNIGRTSVSRREIMERAQVGFSYKFDTPVVPVVARY